MNEIIIKNLKILKEDIERSDKEIDLLKYFDKFKLSKFIYIFDSPLTYSLNNENLKILYSVNKKQIEDNKFFVIELNGKCCFDIIFILNGNKSLLSQIVTRIDILLKQLSDSKINIYVINLSNSLLRLFMLFRGQISSHCTFNIYIFNNYKLKCRIDAHYSLSKNSKLNFIFRGYYSFNSYVCSKFNFILPTKAYLEYVSRTFLDKGHGKIIISPNIKSLEGEVKIINTYKYLAPSSISLVYSPIYSIEFEKGKIKEETYEID